MNSCTLLLTLSFSANSPITHRLIPLHCSSVMGEQCRAVEILSIRMILAALPGKSLPS